MNNLLPKIEDLRPIVDSRLTFSDTPLSREFNKLEEVSKLQILADIVMQTMIYKLIPNPNNDISSLIGDDYTASQVFINYVESLGLFKKVELVLVTNKKNIDIRNFYDCHFSVLVECTNNKEYLVDATPDIGYGIGEVHDLSREDLYNIYIVLDDDMKCFLNIIRNDMHHIQNGFYDKKQIENYKSIRKLLGKDIFDGLLLKYYHCINGSNFEVLKKMMKIDFQDRINYIHDISLQNQLNKLPIIRDWYDSLTKSTDSSISFKKQQKLAQYICSEMNLKKFIEIGGSRIELNHITPRLLWEYGYHVVIIKSSSYLVGIQASCESYMLPKRDSIMASYMSNLGEENAYGLRPMFYFHPHGIKYELQMTGPNKIILVDEKERNLNTRKHAIRKNMAQMIQNHFVNWFNGEKILWDTDLNTNLVHATDDAAEASIHLLAGYPEYQSFTRFRYPNPILRKEKKK